MIKVVLGGESRLTRAKRYLEEFRGREAPANSIGTVLLSGDNKTKMEAMLAEAVRIANDDKYTYSQANRNAEYSYDCSSLVYRLYQEFFNITVPTSTGVYTSQYRIGSTGSIIDLQPGDVLWRSGHVTLYIGNGLYVAAHTHYPSNPSKDITVYEDSPSKYTYVYRFITN